MLLCWCRRPDGTGGAVGGLASAPPPRDFLPQPLEVQEPCEKVEKVEKVEQRLHEHTCESTMKVRRSWWQVMSSCSEVLMSSSYALRH